MSSTSRLIRGACLGAAALGLLASAPAASASDTFTLDNQSKVASLTGTSLWGKGNTMNANCRSGPFPGPTLESFTFNPGNKGTITLSQSPFTKCLAGINPLTENPVTSPFLTNSQWNWIITDPLFGFATNHCWPEGGYGTQALESKVDGLTCTYYDPAPTSSGAFVSSAAPIRGNSAVAFVSHYPGATAGAPQGTTSSARYELVLRDTKGKVHGRRKATVVSGDGRRFKIPVSKELRKIVAEKGAVRIKAELKRVDGQPGNGDKATIVVMKNSKKLPF